MKVKEIQVKGLDLEINRNMHKQNLKRFKMVYSKYLKFTVI